jgi:hypothetical protein
MELSKSTGPKAGRKSLELTVARRGAICALQRALGILKQACAAHESASNSLDLARVDLYMELNFARSVRCPTVDRRFLWRTIVAPARLASLLVGGGFYMFNQGGGGSKGPSITIGSGK